MKNLAILANSWSIAAVGYNEIFVPKFAPWTLDVLESLKDLQLPSSSSDEQQDDNNNINKDCAVNSSPTTKIQQQTKYNCCVPCCGPGQELIPISNILGDSWSVTGVDLAPGMIQVAKERILRDCIDKQQQQQRRQIQAVIGDCSSTLPSPHRQDGSSSEEMLEYDLIVSIIFGFQQMNDPEDVLLHWLKCLSGDAFLVLCFWPSSIESFDENGDDGDEGTGKNYDKDVDTTTTTKMSRPFSLFRQVVKNHLDALSSSGPQNNNAPKVGEGIDTKKVSVPSNKQLQDSHNVSNSNKNNMDNDNPGTTTTTTDELSWDDAVVEKIKSLDCSCQIIKDEYLTHALQWDDFDQFWDSMTNSGPWHAMRLKRGDAFVDGSLKPEYQKYFPNQSSGIVHQARARLIILQKRKDGD